MISDIIGLIRFIKKFGLIGGLRFFYDGKYLKNGESKVFLKGYPSPVFLRRGLSDFTVFDQIFFQQEYGFNLNFNPLFIIDAGANIGLSAVYLAHKYPTAQMVCIEPETSNYQMLQKNTRENENIELLKAGVWNKNAILKIEDQLNHGNWGFTCKEVPFENEYTIPSVSINEIMNKYKRTEIDILKMDVEGAELEIFSGNYEDWLPYTKVIFIELHDWMRKGCSKSFFSALIKYNFSIYTKKETIVCIREQ